MHSSIRLPGAFFIAASASAQPSFVTVGDLPGGFPVSYAFGTSADGSVVTGYSYSDTDITAYRWTSADGMTRLPSIIDSGSYQGSRVSPSGEIIIGRDGGYGAVWSDTFGAVSIGDVPGGIDRSFLYAVSDTGVAVGKGSHARNQFNAPLYRAIRWTSTGGLEAMPLPHPSDLETSSTAWSILSDGRTFGVSGSGAWLYSDATGFEMLEGAEHMFKSNSDGTFLLGTAPNNPTNGNNTPAYWTPGGGLEYLPLIDSLDSGIAYGMSDNGSIIVGTLDVHQVLWIDQGQPMLISDYASSLGIDMDGWAIINVLEVSADGSTITGGARHASWEPGRVEGFVLTIPSPASLLPLASIGLLASRRHRSPEPSLLP